MLPPTQIPYGSPLDYEIFLVVGTAVCVAVPFLIYWRRKPSWLPKAPQPVSTTETPEPTGAPGTGPAATRPAVPEAVPGGTR